MIREYIDNKMRQAKYEILEDGTYYGEIPRVKGIWANADTLEECRHKLEETLEEWVVLGIRMGHSIPGLKFKFSKKNSLHYA